MNLAACLHWSRRPRRPDHGAARRDTPHWVNARIDQPEPVAEEAVPQGCGWFDSSHELHEGLQVTEHLTPEPVVNDVPPGWWLDWQLAQPTVVRPDPRRPGFV